MHVVIIQGNRTNSLLQLYSLFYLFQANK